MITLLKVGEGFLFRAIAKNFVENWWLKLSLSKACYKGEFFGACEYGIALNDLQAEVT